MTTRQPKSRTTTRRRLSVAVALTGIALALSGTGCSSFSGPGSASFASVTIHNHPADEIAASTTGVFKADGYNGGSGGSNQLVFEKEASRATTLSREGIFATQSGAQTINRVRVEIVSLGGGDYRLQCKAYMVTGGSDAFFQDEVPLANIRSGPYQSLLNKVAKELK